jgi:eukaryotic-like serine/threonine-protein kinase
MQRRFGSYLPISCLGRGGFAVVYLCTHIHLNTRAAVKVLHSHMIGEYHELFCKEAQILQALEHPNIVRIKDFAFEDGNPFLVMDYASNGNLRRRYPQGIILSPLTAFSYFKQVADALQYVHNLGLIHRDVKPENMLIGPQGQVLLSDFGISVVMQNIRRQTPSDVLGTVAYMAPEQLRGLPCPASDQYSLGVIAYEWLCGERPFQGSLAEIVQQHHNQPPSPLYQKVSHIPKALEQVVLKALAKEPSQRYSSITSFAQAFEAACLAPKSPALIKASMKPLNVLRGKRISRRKIVIGGLVVGSAGTAAYVAGRLIFPPIPYLVCSYTKHSATVNMVAWSPEGNHIASASNDHTVRVWDASTGNDFVPVYNIPNAKMNSVAWSPDAKYIAVASDDTIVRVWEVNSAQVEYAIYHGHIGGVHSVAWSHYANHIASGAGSPLGSSTVVDEYIHIWSAFTGNEWLTLPIPYPPVPVLNIAWSPDDSYLVSTSREVYRKPGVRPIGNGYQLVHVWDAINGKRLFTYTGHNKDVWGVAWSRDGKYIATASDDRTVKVWKAMTGELVFTYTGHTAEVRSVAWSPDDKYLVSASRDKTVQIWEPVTGQPHPIRTFIGHRDTVLAVAWFPDGKYIASGGSDSLVMVWDAT